jgi:hypothetical protein
MVFIKRKVLQLVCFGGFFVVVCFGFFFFGRKDKKWLTNISLKIKKAFDWHLPFKCVLTHYCEEEHA